MPDKNPAQFKHAILGAGGVGGLIGACLAHAGDSVTLVVRPESVEQYPKKLRLESAFGNFEVDVAVAAEVPPVDVLWLAVKTMQLESALATISNSGAVKAFVPLLNGIDHVARLRSKYGADRIVPATIAVETERVSAGCIVHRSPFARLNVLAAGRTLLEDTIIQLQKTGFLCTFIDDEPTLMWSKLVFLAPYALTTTAADMNTGQILNDATWRDLGFRCIREACAVAIAEGAKVDAGAVIAGVLKLPGTMRSSMQKDVERHNPPELEAIAGPILRGALRHGIEIPVTKKLVGAVEQRAGYKQSRLA